MKNKEKSISSKIEIVGLPSASGFMKDIRERNPEIGLLGGLVNIESDNFFKQIMDTSDKIENNFWESEKENKHTITHCAKLPTPPKEETDDSGYWEGAHYK